MRKLLVLCSFWLCVATLGAQNAERKLYSVAFYNLENLFDTIHDAGKNDYEFLPDGSYQWTAKLYRHLQFKKNARWNADELREKLLEGFRDETEFSYMKGYEPWEKLVSK